MDDERSKILKAIAENPNLLIDSVSTDLEERKAELSDKRVRTQLYLEEQRAIQRMRNRWSNCLLCIINLIVLFDFSFVILLGLKVLDFQNQGIVFAFIGDGLVKIAGLAYLVVNFLFDRRRKSI